MQIGAAAYSGPILRTADAVFAATDGLTPAQLDFRPAKGANSLAAITAHVMGNLREVVLGLLGDGEAEPYERRRDSEFATVGTSSEARAAEWASLRPHLEAAFAQLGDGALARVYRHPRRGELTGHEICLVVLRHMAEHRGHAELTRQIVLQQTAIE